LLADAGPPVRWAAPEKAIGHRVTVGLQARPAAEVIPVPGLPVAVTLVAAPREATPIAATAPTASRPAGRGT
ncbi:hypothetical protein AD945_08420, partial [Gluconobacter albidus]